jgi:hypothetical protein
MSHSFLQGVDGNYSNSRLIADAIILVALIFAQEIIFYGSSNIVTTAAAAGTMFITVAGPALAFLFVQKQNEIKQEKIEKESDCNDVVQ